MRRQIFAAGVATAAIALASLAPAWAGSDVKVPNRSKIEKAVAKLIGGEIDANDSVGRAKILDQIDKLLVKDKKGVALRTPKFWANAIQMNAFADRKAGKTKKLISEEMEVEYADSSTRMVPIVWHGAMGYQSKKPPKLVVTVLPSGTDPKAWLETNWVADDVAKKNWIVAAVAESEFFPVADQPFLMSHAFAHMLSMFNIDADQWYLEGVGTACTAAQRVASEGMPGRLAGLILRDPAKAITNANSTRFPTYVLADAATNKVGAKYKELDAERNVVATAGEGATAALSAWIEANPGRTLPSSYDFVTATGEDRIDAPWTGSVFLISPAKRGEPTAFKVTYDMEANTVSIDGTNVGEFVVYMNDDLVNLDNPITVMCNGEGLEVDKVFERDLSKMFDRADLLGEYGNVFPVEFRGFAPAEIEPDAPDEAGDEKAGDDKAGEDKAGDDKAGDDKGGDKKDGE